MRFKQFYLNENLCEGIDIDSKIELAKKLAKDIDSLEDFLKYDWNFLVYDIKNNSEIEVPLKDIKLVWKVDAENAKNTDLRKYFKNENPKNLPPIELSLQKGGKFHLEDGYHRYFYNKLLRNKNIKAVVDIKSNPFLDIKIQNPEKFYKEFHI